MASTVAGLATQVTALARIEANVPGGLDGLRTAADPVLLELLRGAQGVVRLAQAVVAVAAGEVARRSEADGDGSLARRLGERSAIGVVAKQAGIPGREAAVLVKVGEAIRVNESLIGEGLEPCRPHIANAVASGRISVATADLIQKTLLKIDDALWVDQRDAFEAQLVEVAEQGWSFADFTAYCKRIPDHLDPDGAEPREDALRALARIVETRLPNGLLRITADLHPELEGWWKTAMAAKTNPRRNVTGKSDTEDGMSETGNADDPSGEPIDPAQPTPMERKLEALTTILRQSIQVDDGQAAGIDVTLLVTIDAEALEAKVGAAQIFGVDEPISAATARRLAGQANIIPQVLTGKSVVLDQGLSKRLFTKQQRYALATRDRGCTFPCCRLPPGMTEVNHIDKWRHSSPSDLSNGALLCGFHNRLLERGWEMEIRDGEPWFIPPIDVDLTRTPIRGGKPRLSSAA